MSAHLQRIASDRIAAAVSGEETLPPIVNVLQEAGREGCRVDRRPGCVGCLVSIPGRRAPPSRRLTPRLPCGALRWAL